MKTLLLRILAIVSLTYANISAAAINPVTVNYLGGITAFPMNYNGIANYVVTMNAGVIPPNAPLTFHLTSTGSSSEALTATQITSGASTCSGVSALCHSTFSLRAGQRCCLAFALESSTAGSYTLQPTMSTTPSTYSAQASSALNVTVSGPPSAVTLTSSPSTLALSVNDTATNAALTGNPRQITITNTSTTETAYHVFFSVQNPTTANPGIATNGTPNTSCGNIAPSGTCIITVTPTDATASATPYDTSPTPITLTITGDNTNTLNPTINILAYGSVYQEGYVYSIDDSYADYPVDVSVGGKIAALTDQAAASSNGIVWSSNGTVGISTDWTLDTIPYISQTANPDDDYNAAQTTFNSTYSNTGTYPFPPSNLFLFCAGATDGACNSSNILTLYNTYVTNYGLGSSPYALSPGPTTLSYYAAGLCNQPIGSYSDWYLPAICEEGYDATNAGSGCGTSSSPTLQNMTSNLPSLLNSCIGSACLNGYYWSSTQYFNGSPSAWSQYFAPSSNNYQLGELKSSPLGVRCSRALTP